MASHHHGYECTCMLDGPEYIDATALAADARYEIMRDQNTHLIEENKRLKALLTEHGIIEEVRGAGVDKSRAKHVPKIKNMPHLPKEIQLKILGYAMQCEHPIIDPFWKPRQQHLTSSEKRKRKEISLNFLATCKAFHSEGLELFVASNNFVFTQVAALINFANVPSNSRTTIEHVTLRIVGRYYDNEPRKQNILGENYHIDLRDHKMPIFGRPPGATMDKGIQAFCYQQFTDFLKALQVPSGQQPRAIQKLFPSLKTMRIDLVNFCDHLFNPGRDFSTVIRWHTGPIVDELIITGVPEDDPEEGVESLIDRLVKREGVYASGPPVFVSMTKCLKPLTPAGLVTRVVRCEKSLSKVELARIEKEVHPEGGKHPKSQYPPGRTIWKWTQDDLRDQEKRWIEFDRRSGYPAEHVDMLSDVSEDMYYSDDNYLDSDEDWSDSEDEGTDSDGIPYLEELD